MLRLLASEIYKRWAMIIVDLPNEGATGALAARVAAVAKPGDVIALRGDLGAGKTSFVRAFIRARGAADATVPSPTFTLVQVYELPEATIWHFDFYRLRRPEEAWELGIEEAFAEGISLIEWPERAGALLPPETLEIALLPGSAPDARRAEISGGPGWTSRLAAIGAAA
jgi:tRNA threonylcarbamoyladenosine biosynthesis protein TsaE